MCPCLLVNVFICKHFDITDLCSANIISLQLKQVGLKWEEEKIRSKGLSEVATLRKNMTNLCKVTFPIYTEKHDTYIKL